MTKKLIIVFSFFLILASIDLQAQNLDPVKIESSTSVSGDTLTIMVEFSIEENWMVYDSLGGEVGPIPISFDHNAILNLEFISIKKPKTKHKYDDIFEVDLWYFTNKASYELSYIITDSNLPYLGVVSLEFMSCNLTNGVCLPPKSVDIPVK